MASLNQNMRLHFRVCVFVSRQEADFAFKVLHFPLPQVTRIVGLALEQQRVAFCSLFRSPVRLNKR